MKLKNVLLLEPINTPIEVLTKDQNIRNSSKKNLLIYAIGLIYRKYRLRLTSLHSIPLGLAQLSSIAKQKNIDTHHIPFILDATKRYINDDEIERKIRAFDYNEVWMTIGSPEAAHESFRYANIVKKINQATTVMIGGILPSMYPEFFLKHSSIDHLIRGPAEVAIQHYIQNPSLSERKHIQGFCFRTNRGKINISPYYAVEPDLSAIPPYDFEGLCINEYMKDNHFCNIQASRGCPFNCPFCAHAKFWGLEAKFRPLNNLRQELKILENYGCRGGYLVDSTFTLNKQRLSKFIEMYEDAEIHIKLMFETRADLFTDDIAKLTKRMDPFFVWFGAESGSPQVLEKLNGKDHDNGYQHSKNLLNAVRTAKKYDLLCGSSWVIGLPGENWQSVQETKDLIFKLDAAGMDIADIRILQIFPGTPYWNDPNRWGLKIFQREEVSATDSPWDKYAGHETEKMTANQIERAAERLKNELFNHYLTKTKNIRGKRKIKVAS